MEAELLSVLWNKKFVMELDPVVWGAALKRSEKSLTTCLEVGAFKKLSTSGCGSRMVERVGGESCSKDCWLFMAAASVSLQWHTWDWFGITVGEQDQHVRRAGGKNRESSNKLKSTAAPHLSLRHLKPRMAFRRDWLFLHFYLPNSMPISQALTLT